ncbi:3-hydroxyacyl-CoA dehydrogenase [Candidatus Sulfopaludibacter sp. SbA4]|nr:3-hydroxyacyl-CoA dehydrogenase [Candidatus Sulfopaludibacter sp. SbA4]
MAYGTGWNTAAVIGTGMMGPGIALTLALGGMRATILSRTDDGAARGVDKAMRQAQILAENGLVTADWAARAAARIVGSTAFDQAITAADLVVESAPEDLAFKQDLFARMDGLAGPRTVLASNTSGLSITAIAAGCRLSERVLTTHFWNPPHLIPLVEIVKGEKTSDGAASAVRQLLIACGKTPVIVKKDRPGQLGNRLQMALVREAANIVAEGIADVEDVDSVVKNGLGLRMPAYGILEHMDVAGLDLAISVLEYVVRDLYNEPRAPEYLREMVRRGDLGAKTGRGFYDWSSKSADEVRARRDAFLVEVLRWRKR